MLAGRLHQQQSLRRTCVMPPCHMQHVTLVGDSAVRQVKIFCSTQVKRVCKCGFWVCYPQVCLHADRVLVGVCTYSHIVAHSVHVFAP